MPSDKGQPKRDLRTVFDAPRGLEGRVERDRNSEAVAWQLRGSYHSHVATNESMKDTRNLQEQFTQEMHHLCEQIRDEAKLPFPSRFKPMINENGDGVAAVRRLIQRPAFTDTLVKLFMKGYRHLTVEYVILKPKWHELFTDDERGIARERLGLNTQDL